MLDCSLQSYLILKSCNLAIYNKDKLCRLQYYILEWSLGWSDIFICNLCSYILATLKKLALLCKGSTMTKRFKVPANSYQLGKTLYAKNLMSGCK